MRELKGLIPVCLFLLAASPLAALTVDEVIAKHIEARGGLETWQKIKSLKISGSYSGFSKVSPFALHRERLDASPRKAAKYHLDYVLDGRQMTLGYDGRTAWWINLWQGAPWAQQIGGHDLKVFMQDVDFESPFFDYQAKGYRVELLGEGDLDGQKALKLELTRPDASVETWYLDPETYLEIGYDAVGSDFGTPQPQRAFIEDFREVNGVMMPHYIEKQWYTRLRIMEVEDVQTNLEIADELFHMPLPGEMNVMQAMVGEWTIKGERRQSPQAPWQETEATASIAARMGGAMLEESSMSPEGIEVVRILTYDRFKERYRLTQMNSLTSHLDVQEGAFAEGRLTVSNAETDTSWQGFGFTFHQRLTFSGVTPAGFKVEAERSTDGGETWFVNYKATYARKAD